MQTSVKHETSSNPMDEKFMLRCIQLAKNGLGTTAPNPMVGAVVVHNNQIIGEGYTSPYGGPHAEVHAIESVANKNILQEATLYVTLEPCSHFGKTPPCADLLIKHKVKRVVIGLRDPHKKVAGEGIKKLIAAGCEVIVGVLEQECRAHHKRFLTVQEKQRPYIILKWAETSDGFIAPKKENRDVIPQPYWITGKLSRQLVHKWRSEEQAILVGTATAIADNPKLDVRLWTGKSPIRVLLDKDLKVPSTHHILDKKQRTIVFTMVTDSSKHLEGIEYIILTTSMYSTAAICNQLYKLNIQSIIIEGGTKTLQSFIEANLWDEARVFKGTSEFKNGIKGPQHNGTLITEKCIDKDLITFYRND